MSQPMVRIAVALFAGALMVSVVHSSLCAENAPAPASPADQQVVTGEVVDPASYLKDGHRGTEMSEQTYAAVDGGQTLALLQDGTNNLYLLVAEQAGEDPNELAYDYVNQQVKAVGRVYERGGLRGFAATSIEPAVPVTPKPAAASALPSEKKPAAN